MVVRHFFKYIQIYRSTKFCFTYTAKYCPQMILSDMFLKDFKIKVPLLQKFQLHLAKMGKLTSVLSGHLHSLKMAILSNFNDITSTSKIRL